MNKKNLKDIKKKEKLIKKIKYEFINERKIKKYKSKK
jgi:hypothetical protein